jgi:hypothetical protein
MDSSKIRNAINRDEEKNVDLFGFLYFSTQQADSNKRMHTINRLLQGDEALWLFCRE